MECAACLDVLVVRKLVPAQDVEKQKEQLAGILRMLVGLLKRFSPRADVLMEEGPEYAMEAEDQDQDQDQEQE